MGPVDSGFVTIGFVSGIVSGTNINDTHDRLGWLKVTERLKISILSFSKIHLSS